MCYGLWKSSFILVYYRKQKHGRSSGGQSNQIVPILTLRLIVCITSWLLVISSETKTFGFYCPLYLIKSVARWTCRGNILQFLHSGCETIPYGCHLTFLVERNWYLLSFSCQRSSKIDQRVIFLTLTIPKMSIYLQYFPKYLDFNRLHFLNLHKNFHSEKLHHIFSKASSTGTSLT